MRWSISSAYWRFDIIMFLSFNEVTCCVKVKKLFDVAICLFSCKIKRGRNPQVLPPPVGFASFHRTITELNIAEIEVEVNGLKKSAISICQSLQSAQYSVCSMGIPHTW